MPLVCGRMVATFLIILAIVTGCQVLRPEAAPQTLEPVSAFVFTAAGDYGVTDDTTATLDLIARSGASFNLALGDLSYSNTLSESAWCDYVQSKVGAAFPFQLIAGNHEDDFGEDGHISKFAACLPDRMDSVGDYAKEYYFDYQGLARFIMISPDLTIDGEHYFYGEANDHYNWVANAIDSARAANIPWVIIGMHKNCLSMGDHYCNIYQELLNLLIEKKVDLVLHGHDHTYQRSRQLAASTACPIVEIDSYNASCVLDDGDDNVYTKGAGTVFVVIGSAGAELYGINTSDSEAGYFVKWMGKNSNPRKGVMNFRVSHTEILAQFVGSTTTSNFTDNFTIQEAER
jgi:3',5'-cyclic AMP phosphodiesterase CpdA